MILLRKVRSTLSFLTVVPFGGDDPPVPLLFPAVGFCIGFFVWFISIVLKRLFPLDILSFIIVFTLCVLTGFFHLDGLSDAADVLFLKGGKEKLLSIMDDSRIGCFGASFLVLVLLGKFLFIKAILRGGALWILPFPFAYSRWSPVFISSLFTPAKCEGLGFMTKEVTEKRGNLDLKVATLMVFIPSLISAKLVLTFFAILVFLYGSGVFWKRKIGGFTGDILGFSIELSELFSLFLLSFLFGRGA